MCVLPRRVLSPPRVPPIPVPTGDGKAAEADSQDEEGDGDSAGPRVPHHQQQRRLHAKTWGAGECHPWLGTPQTPPICPWGPPTPPSLSPPFLHILPRTPCAPAPHIPLCLPVVPLHIPFTSCPRPPRPPHPPPHHPQCLPHVPLDNPLLVPSHPLRVPPVPTPLTAAVHHLADVGGRHQPPGAQEIGDLAPDGDDDRHHQVGQGREQPHLWGRQPWGCPEPRGPPQIPPSPAPPDAGVPPC